jgi:hypothetical protein
MYDWTDETIAKSLSGQGAFPLSTVLQDSLYYPASGFDGSPIRHANPLKANSFVYADTFATEADFGRALICESFRGYSIFGQRILSQSDLTPSGWKPVVPKGFEEKLQNAYCDAMRMANANSGTAFARWIVFVRNADLGVEHGPHSFSLLLIRGEGVATYQALYGAQEVLPKIVAIVRPGISFGGNYSMFEEFLYGVMNMHPLGMPPELLEWHFRDRADRISSLVWREMYPRKLLGPLSKDREPNFALSLYAQDNSCYN